MWAPRESWARWDRCGGPASDNTFFWIDRQEELIGLLLVQVRPFGHLDLMERFRVLVQQAVDD